MKGKFRLYVYTVKNLRPSQIYYRIKKRLGFSISLGVKVKQGNLDTQTIPSPYFLDFDKDFLDRYSISEIMNGRLSLLFHSSDTVDFTRWKIADQSDLWNYNLHYFEYLFPLIDQWRNTGMDCFLEKAKYIIDSWINKNAKGVSPAWDPYPTSLRIVTWISFYSYTNASLDPLFKKKFVESLFEQYEYLTMHLEKDLLGNHYFENLKSIVLASLFFKDERVFRISLDKFKKECAEEILPDGMHFEMSPMYHKIVLEGIIRVAYALRKIWHEDHDLELLVQRMINVAYSLEESLSRIPLFNDCGNNVAKSLNSLIKSAKAYFNITPQHMKALAESGYYIFDNHKNHNRWKLIVDSGSLGPNYNPGHSHCDAMSFELFYNGNPIIVNCGTYAYQTKYRNYYRSAESHNTVMIDKNEQSQLWGQFRVAKRSQIVCEEYNQNSIDIRMMDYLGNQCRRSIIINGSDIIINDKVIKGKVLYSRINFPKGIILRRIGNEIIFNGGTLLIESASRVEHYKDFAAYDFGKLDEVDRFCIIGNDITYRISISDSDYLNSNAI